MSVFGYIRVSTERQADEGISLGAQERTVEGYAMMHGFTLDRIFIERGVSGAKPLAERPEGSKLLQALSTDDVVITPRLDRMFRSALDALDVLANLKQRSVSLHMLDLGGDVCGNGISKLVFTILSAVAEAERDRIRERIRDIKRDQRMRGRYLGGTVPFGWHLGPNGELLELPDQQVAIVRMRQMKSEGKSLRAIAGEMKAAGYLLSHVGVKNALGRVA
jgi:DNA invertase Pin-like site-specific DNA recombinase